MSVIDIYQDLLNVSDVLKIVMKYITYSKARLYYSFLPVVQKAGSILYRVRKFDSNVDYSDLHEWDPSPYKLK